MEIFVLQVQIPYLLLKNIKSIVILYFFLDPTTFSSFGAAGEVTIWKESCHPYFCLTLHIIMKMFHYVNWESGAGMPEAGDGKDRDGNRKGI